MAFPCGNDGTAAGTDNIEVSIPKEASGPAEHGVHRKVSEVYDGTSAGSTIDDRGGGSSTSTSNKKSMAAPANSPGTSNTSERPAKKMKRGKYISRAWCVPELSNNLPSCESPKQRP